jgi:hypothetical protein
METPMMKTVTTLAAAALLTLAMQVASAADEKPYSDGPIVNVSYIKTKPGQFEAYMKYLATTYKQLMESEKKAGYVLSWSVYRAQPHSATEADLILTTTYKNWAALDGISDRINVEQKKVWTNQAGISKAQVDREALRETLGSDTVQQLVIK